MAIPYGYKVVKGRAVIDEVEAEQVRMVFKGYLSGLAYVVAAEEVGLKLSHPSVKRILQNKRYPGDKYYPAIIDRETFERAEAERFKRQRQMGRIFPDKPVEECKPATKFIMPKAGKIFIDPFKQAEYVYSLIESEVER
jgi:hypothetical protein